MGQKEITVPVYQKITLTIDEAAGLSSIGINKLNELAKTPAAILFCMSGRRNSSKEKSLSGSYQKVWKFKKSGGSGLNVFQ